MSDPDLIQGIKEAVTIPVMAKARIGHFVEAQVIQALGIDYIDESEVLTPADDSYHIDKHPFDIHLRAITDDIRRLGALPREELMTEARDMGAPYELVLEVAETGSLPVVLFCAGGVATPADAALVMQLGAEGVFVGSGIFKSDNPPARAKAIVEATTNYRNPAIIAEVSRGIGEAMRGLNTATLPESELMASRGW
jgi:pyridoxal 5'-phosphate synthase pdxS subunit